MLVCVAARGWVCVCTRASARARRSVFFSYHVKEEDFPFLVSFLRRARDVTYKWQLAVQGYPPPPPPPPLPIQFPISREGVTRSSLRRPTDQGSHRCVVYAALISVQRHENFHSHTHHDSATFACARTHNSSDSRISFNMIYPCHCDLVCGLLFFDLA